MGNYQFFTIWVEDRKKSICPKCFRVLKPQGAASHINSCKGEWEDIFDKFKDKLSGITEGLKFDKGQIDHFTKNFKLENPFIQDDSGDDDMVNKKKKEKDDDDSDDSQDNESGDWKKPLSELSDKFTAQFEKMETWNKDLVKKFDEKGETPEKPDDSDKDKKKDKETESGSGSGDDDSEYTKGDIALILVIIIIISVLISGYVGLELQTDKKDQKKTTDTSSQKK